MIDTIIPIIIIIKQSERFSGLCPEKEIEKAKNIVRIEIRCMEGKVSELKKKFNLKHYKKETKFEEKNNSVLK